MRSRHAPTEAFTGRIATALVARGYCEYKSHKEGSVLYQRQISQEEMGSNVLGCSLNDGRLYFNVYVYELDFDVLAPSRHSSFELSISAQDAAGFWWDLTVRGHDAEAFIAGLPRLEAQLIAAWAEM